jgi:hypothetical protein
MWVMSVYVDKLLELEELEVTNQQILRYCGLKDRSTITEWWKGVIPLPKNRVKLTRLLEIAREGRETPPTLKQVFHAFRAFSDSKEGRESLESDKIQSTFQHLIQMWRGTESFDPDVKIHRSMSNAKLCEKFHPEYRVRQYFKEYNALI